MILELDRAKGEITRNGAKSFAGSFHPPSPPGEHVDEIQRVIETTDDQTIIEPLAKIIRELQTLWSRTGVFNDVVEMNRNVGIPESVDFYIIQAVQLYALTESLFDYARSKSNNGPAAVGWDRVEQILMRFGIETKDLFDLVGIELKKGKNFWVRS